MSKAPINWNELSNEEAQAVYEQQLAQAQEESRRQWEAEYYASQHGSTPGAGGSHYVGAGQEEEEGDEYEQEVQPSKPTRGPSIAWNYFKKGDTITPSDTGETGKPFYYAYCQECKNMGKETKYKTEVGGGTGTLIRHLLQRHGIDSKGKQSKQNQTQISGFASSEPGTGMPFRYTQDNMINEMADFVIADEQPFTFGMSKAYTRMNRRALHPGYKECNNNIVQRRSFKRFYKAQKELIKELDEFKGRVCLTSDCWSAPHTSDSFMCVTVHWIDTRWVLQKRIIVFELFNE